MRLLLPLILLFMCLFSATSYAKESSSFSLNAKPSISLTQKEIQFINQHPVIRVGGEMDWPPFDFIENGQYVGVAKEYLELLEKYTGLKFDVVTGYTWNELLEMFNKGQLDLMPMIYYTAERAKKYNYTDKYLTIRQYVFVHESTKNIGNFMDLNGLIIAIPKGYAQIKILKANYPNIKILEVPSPIDAIDAVLTKKADALFENSALISYLLKQNNISGIKAVFGTNIGINEIHMASREKLPLLRSILQKGLNAITNIEKEQIIKRWMSINTLKPALQFTSEEKNFIRNHQCLHQHDQMQQLPIVLLSL